MGEVVTLLVSTTVDEPADQILEKAKDWGLDDVLIVGYDREGNLLLGGNMADAAQMSFLLDRAKQWIMDQV